MKMVQPGLPQQVESNMYLLDASAFSAAAAAAAAVPGGSGCMRMDEDVHSSVDFASSKMDVICTLEFANEGQLQANAERAPAPDDAANV